MALRNAFENLATEAKQTTIISHVDGIEALLTTIDADTSILSVTGGGVETGALRVTIANNSTGVLSIDDNAGSLTVDGSVSVTSGTITTVSAVTAITNALPAGTNAIGKLAANSGIDIGDVDVLSIIPGTGATNLGKAVDSAGGATDTGVAVLTLRDDALAAVSPADGDYARMRSDSTGRLWVSAKVDSALPTGANAIGSITNTSFAVTDNSGSLTVDAPVGTPVFVRLSSGSAAVDTLPVSIASVPSHAVTNAGTFAVQVTSAPTTAVTGTFWQATQPVSIATLPTLAAGTNNIGDVDVLSLPALATGSNTIGAVNIAAAQTLATVTTVGTVTTCNLASDDVHDSAAGTSVVMGGGYAYGYTDSDNSPPTISANADAARFLTNKNGAQVVVHLPDSCQTYAPTNVTTTAYAASLVIKATAGTLYVVTGYNSKTAAQFIQIHDSATLPADTAVPKVIFSVPPLGNFSYDLGNYGRYFANGITICNSSTGPTKTIGSADCWIDAQFK